MAENFDGTLLYVFIKLASKTKKTVDLFTDRERPWRKVFLAHRVIESSPRFRQFTPKTEKRIKNYFKTHPDAIQSFLVYIDQAHGSAAAKKVIMQLDVKENARRKVEIAKYYFSKNMLSHGDKYLEEAKTIDPDLLEIFSVEAETHRVRGNIHRELEAATKSLQLSANTGVEHQWLMRVGETYLKLEQFETAWKYLMNFDFKKSELSSLLAAAGVAADLGEFNLANSIYMQIAPSRDGFDHIKIAGLQFETWNLKDEARRLLSNDDFPLKAEASYLMYKMSLTDGKVDEALNYLYSAVSTAKKNFEYKKELAYFLHVYGKHEEAMALYKALPISKSYSFARSLYADLLVDCDLLKEAAYELYLPKKVSRKLKASNFNYEVDPTITRLIKDFNSSTKIIHKQIVLEELLPRLSDRKQISDIAGQLARIYFEQSKWESAVNVARRRFSQRKPAICINPKGKYPINVSLDIEYAEWSASEPVNSDVILYESSLGANTSCNPLAICLELLKNPVKEKITHVWSINEGVTIYPELLKYNNVVFVRKGSSGHRRYLATAGIVINNSTWETCFTKRDGQLTLNTWHGIPWKTLGKDQITESFEYGNIARSFLQADILLAPDSHTASVMTKSMDIDSLIPEKNILKIGYPRNDLTLNLTQSRKSKMREELGIPADKKIVFYAPTWKGLFDKRVPEVEETWHIANSLSSGGYSVILRAHHYVKSSFIWHEDRGDVRVAPDHFDTNELIGIADVVVTDFSSVLFDAASSNKPVIKILNDYDRYNQERGLYFHPNEVPGKNAYTVVEARDLLKEAVSSPSSFISFYANQTKRFTENEDGRSAKRVAEFIFSVVNQKMNDTEDHNEVKSLYFSPGGLLPNGITRAARSILRALEFSKFQPHVVVTKNSLNNASQATVEDLKRTSKILPTVGNPAGTRMEREVLWYFSQYSYTPNELMDNFLEKGREREARRLFGPSKFYSAIEYSSYDSPNIALAAMGINIDQGKRGIILHNEMVNEVNARFPRVKSGLSILNNFDFIASVSDGLKEYNIETLQEQFGIEKNKHITLENTIVPGEILAMGQHDLPAKDKAWFEMPGKHVCVVARLSHEKNHLELLEAIAEMHEEISERVRFIILGDGPLRVSIAHTIESAGLQNIVYLCGQVSNPYPYIVESDVMLLPSKYEGQPIVILESLTLGTPVIATETPGSRSALQGGELGKLVSISKEGLKEAIRSIDKGKLVSPLTFNAEKFTNASAKAFENVIS